MKPVESRQAQQMHVPIHPSKIEYNLSPTQDQASTALEEDPSPIQDQASTALGSTSTVRKLQNAPSTRDKHMYAARLEVGAFVDSEISINKMLTDGQNFNTRVLHKLYTYCMIRRKFEKS